MGNILTKLSRTYRGLARIKEQATEALEGNRVLLNKLLEQKAAEMAADTEARSHGGNAEEAHAADAEKSSFDASNTPEVSVVVPVLNTAEFLPKCLNSLKNQTLSNIEIICVDDGSTDDSLKILNQYAQEDARIVVVSQDHKGVSAARNAATTRARAPYLMSCDSDDWFDVDMCRIMRDTLEQQEVDVVICGMNVNFDVPEELQQNVNEYLRLKESGKHKLTQEAILVNDVSLCNKIYKKSIVDQHGIDFPEGLLFEDAYFNDAYMTAADTIYYLHLPLYNYLRHSASVMSTSYKKTGTSLDYLQIAFKTWDYFEKEGLLETHAEYYWRRFIQYAAFAFKHLEGPERAEAKKEARAFAREHKDNLAKASLRTRGSVKVLLYGRFKIVHMVYRFPKWLYATFSITRSLRNEVIELMKQNQGVQAQAHALLFERSLSEDK